MHAFQGKRQYLCGLPICDSVLVEHAAKVRVFQTVQSIYSAPKIQSSIYLSKLLHAHCAHGSLVHI